VIALSCARRENVPALAVSLLLAAGAKLAYSRAGVDALVFLTAPTTLLVTGLTGVGFEYEAGYGYVSRDHMLVIAQACAGVNYLLAVFGLLCFTVVPQVGPRLKLLAVFALAAPAYAVTVAVNALRISLGLALHEADVAWGWLDATRVHRLAGIVVYFLALVATYAVAGRVVDGGRDDGEAARSWVRTPLAWYGLVALAVPLANGALLARPRLFLEHAAWVLGVALLLAYVVSRPRAIRTLPERTSSAIPKGRRSPMKLSSLSLSPYRRRMSDSGP
jgi:exosortase K